VINHEYLRGTAFGTGFPVHGIRLPTHVSRRVEYETDDFSFLLNLEEIQRSQLPATEEISDTEFSILERRHSLNQGAQNFIVSAGFSIEEFERDMDLLAAGLENIHIGYQGTYPREDIYMDHD
jgi:hypothetical protein